MKKTNPQYRNTYLHFLFSHLGLFLSCKVHYVYHIYCNTIGEALITTYQPPE